MSTQEMFLDKYDLILIISATPSVNTTLKLTGNSSAQVDVSLRVFDETKSTWMLTGNCESDNGMVQISGDIDMPFSVSCLNDSFSAGINYSVSSPYFISGSSVSRKIKISQSSSSDEVLLYKTSSSKPVNYLRDMTDINNISDPVGIYIYWQMILMPQMEELI